MEDEDFPLQINVGNETYCWHHEMEAYSWCPDSSNQSSAAKDSVSLDVLIGFCILYGTVSLISVIGNFLVIWVVSTTKTMHNINNGLLANLALSDVTIAIFCIPFQFYAALLQRWDLPQFMCNFCPFAQTFSVNGSIFTLVAIAHDRYQAVMKPLATQTTKRNTCLLFILIWAGSFVLSIPQALLHEYRFIKAEQGVKPFCSTRQYFYTDLTIDQDNNLVNKSQVQDSHSVTTYEVYNVFLLLFQYAIPLVVITFLYCSMSLYLWRYQPPGIFQDEREVMLLLQKKKSIKLMISVVITFGICWLPWHVFHLSTLLWPQVTSWAYIQEAFFACHWLAMSNSCYNPFIYALLSEKFNEELKKRVTCKTCRESPGTAQIEMMET